MLPLLVGPVSFITLTLITSSLVPRLLFGLGTRLHNILLHASIVMQIPTGTVEVKRTTVPFMYNLEEDVEGLNVVDFPGVDDEDDTIGDLADLLVTIAQIIIFVVDYRCVCLVSRF